MLNPRSGAYGGGYGDFFGYQDLLAEWRAQRRLRRAGSSTSCDDRHERATVRRDASRSSPVVRSASAPRSPRSSGARACSSSPSTPASTVDGTTAASGDAETTTAQRIVAAGGQARASNISVTDDDAVRALFAELVDEFGALDAVVNVAGISRPTGFASGDEDDWRAVLERAPRRLPQRAARRAAASWPRPATAGSSASRRARGGARPTPARTAARSARSPRSPGRSGRRRRPGVTVNALSPIAATRMVLGALAARPARATGRRDSSTGGVSLGLDVGAPARAPRSDRRVPRGRDVRRRGARGQIMFSNGAEVAWVVPPRLLEVARTSDVGSLLAVLESFGSDGRSRRPRPRRPATAAATRVSAPRSPTARPTASAVGGRDACRRRQPTSPRRAPRSTDALAARGVECVDHRRSPRRPSPAAASSSRPRSRELGSDRRRRRRPRRRGASSPAAEDRAGSACSTSTPGSPTTSAATRRGCARCPTTPRRPIGPSGSSPWSTPRRPAVAAGPRRPRSSRAPRTRRPTTGSTRSRSASRPPGVGAAGRGDRRATWCATPTPARCRAPSSSSAPTGSACAATRTRRARSRSAVPTSPAGSTARSASMVSGSAPHARRGGVMAAPIERIVDAHIHLWDPGHTPTGTRTWPVSASSTWATSRGCAGCSTSRRTSPSRRTGTSSSSCTSPPRPRRTPAPRPRSCEELAEATGHPDAIIGGIVPERPDRRHRAPARRADAVAAVPRHPADGRRDGRARRRRPARARRA